MKLSKKNILNGLIVFSLFIFTFGSINANAEKITDLEKNVVLSNTPKPKLNVYDYKRGLFVANQEKKYILLTFCTQNNFCSKLYNETYVNPSVKKILDENFILVDVNAESKNILIFEDKKMQEKDLVKIYKIDNKFPTINFLDSKGEKISGTIKGFIPSNKFLDILKYISSNSYTKMKFDEFLKKEKTK